MAKFVSLVLLALLSLLGFALGTHTVAEALHYAPALGPAWGTLGGTPVYAPWAWLEWMRFERVAPEAFRTASGMATLGPFLGVLVVAAIALRRRRPKASTSHGSSRWATTAEMKSAGLLQPAGVVLGQADDARYRTRLVGNSRRITMDRGAPLLRHDGPEHVMCFAPTRSGKGVGLVLPTLLSWPHSVLVYDIKKENWSLSAGWRRQFSRVWRFEPTSPDSLRFNPLLEIRKGLLEFKDTQNIADILVDPNGEKQSRDHWQTTAHTLLTGAILHVLYAEQDKTLAGVAAFLSDPSRRQFETLRRMLETPHLGPNQPHSGIAQAAREMLNKSENELSGVMSTALACLGLYRDPIVGRATSASDFRIADLMNADVPVSLYLVVPPGDLTRTRPIIRLMLNQIARRLTESMEFGDKKAYRHRLLLLLDEFPSLGRLDFFQSALAFSAGYGLKSMMIAQSLNQLEEAYGQHNSILDNCHVRVTYASNDDKTSRRVSDLLGQTTVVRKQTSYSGSGLFLSNRTESEQEHARALLTPAEVNQLPDDDGIVFVAGQLPYRVRKVRHFLDPRFRGRDKLPPPAPGTDQARELIELPPSEWAGLRAEPPAKPPQAPSESPVGAIPLDRLAEAVWAAEVLADPERARLRTAAEVAADLDGATAHSSAAGANPLPSSMAAPSASAMAGWKEVLAAARPEASPADGDAGDAGDAQEDLL